VQSDLLQPAAHRVGDGRGLHGGVEDHALQFGRLHGPHVERKADGGFGRKSDAVLTKQAPKNRLCKLSTQRSTSSSSLRMKRCFGYSTLAIDRTERRVRPTGLTPLPS
jgi:hypothetical protein